MSSKKREYHILMVTKTSFYDAGLMKTSTDIPKSALKQVFLFTGLFNEKVSQRCCK